MPLLLAVAASGCGTMSDGRRWGQDATLTPGWDRVAKAAKDALLTPEVWAPAAGALALQVDHADRRIADWAGRTTPVYGSRDGALNAGHDLVAASGAAYWTSVVVAPDGDSPENWLVDKAKVAAVGVVATTGDYQLAEGLQRATRRTRPNGAADGFPSLDVSYAASQDMSALKNMAAVPMPPWGMPVARGGLDGITLATAWARVESHEHYPSDTLAAMSLACFLSSFLSDAFLGSAPVRVAATGQAYMIAVSLPF